MKTLLGTLIEKAKDNLGDYLISTSLCEMAIDRKKYESEVKSLTPQIFENIILVYIAKHELRYSQFLNHWNSELTTHLNAISDYTIKNDSPEKRRKVIDTYWRKMDYDWRDLPIQHMTMKKMKMEGISIDSDVYKNALVKLHNDISFGILQDVLVSSNPNAIEKYVESL